jgi:hypothetical protein
MRKPKVERPTLALTLPVDEFHRWYWLKEALIAFCRQQRLPATGSKVTLAARIAALLTTGKGPTTLAASL